MIVFESLTRKNVIKISVGERYHLQGETECISGALLRSRIQKVVERQHFFIYLHAQIRVVDSKKGRVKQSVKLSLI